MSLQGLPDFQRPIRGEGFAIFYPFEGAGEFTVTPDRLNVAEHADGRPDLVLRLYRGQNPLLLPAPYGVLDLRLQPQYAMTEALTVLRGRHPQARLQPAYFADGFLRLYAQSDDEELPADLRAPMRLAWNGLSNARYLVRMSLDSAMLLKGALHEEALLLSALAEMEMTGVAPRLPVHVRFDPSRLLPALRALCDEEGRVARDALLAFFSREPDSLELEVEGEVAQPSELAEAMTDWVRARYGSFVSAPVEDGRGYMALDLPMEIGSGRFEWDLSQPRQTWQPLVLSLRPLDAARQLVQQAGLEAVVPPPVIVPAIPTGMFTVDISANLPASRPGVLAVGVTLRAAPRPPFRPQAVIQSAELIPPEDRATVRLRLSPVEALEYRYATFVITQDSSGIRQLDEAEIGHDGASLSLTPDSFPLIFVTVEAARDLLELATIHGTCRWIEAERMVEQAVELGADVPALALALPRKANAATLHFEARPHEDGQSLSLGPLPARPVQLGLHSFREYGPHRVQVEAIFADSESLVAIDLAPETRAEDTEALTVLALTRDQPRKEWGYLASSPFRAGYRYRLHAGPDGIAGPWSAVRSPFEPLVLRATSKGNLE